MNIEASMNQLLEEYYDLLTPELRKNTYPIIKKSFIPYLKHEFLAKNYSIDYLFTHVVTRECIISAGIHYVDNTKKVTDVAAVSKFLSAVAELYRKILFPRYPSCALRSINDDFQGLREEIVEKSQKKLNEKSPYAHLTGEDYEDLNNYLNLMDETQYKQQIIVAVFRLILLYGFKIGTISSLKKRDFDEQRRLLRVKGNGENRYYLLELPYLLSKQIERIKSIDNNTDYLFMAENGDSLASDYFDNTLKNISTEIRASSKITTTAMSKYAAVNMFLEGINPITISEITGMGDANLRYCQRIAYERTEAEDNINRYLNSRLRNIRTYDDFNF